MKKYILNQSNKLIEASYKRPIKSDGTLAEYARILLCIYQNPGLTHEQLIRKVFVDREISNYKSYYIQNITDMIKQNLLSKTNGKIYPGIELNNYIQQYNLNKYDWVTHTNKTNVINKPIIDNSRAELMTISEAQNTDKKLLLNNSHYFLKNQGNDQYSVAYIDYSGWINKYGTSIFNDMAIRPILHILDLNDNKIGYTFKINKYYFKIINETCAIIQGSLGYNRFDSESNDYEKSEAKQIVDNWFEKEIEPYLTYSELPEIKVKANLSDYDEFEENLTEANNHSEYRYETENIDADAFAYIYDSDPTYQEVIDNYDQNFSKSDYNEIINLINNYDPDYYYDHGQYLELSDNRTMYKVLDNYEICDENGEPTGEFDEDWYWEDVGEFIKQFNDYMDTDVQLHGRSGRHVCISETPENQLRYNEIKNKWEECEEAFVNSENYLDALYSNGPEIKVKAYLDDYDSFED